MKVYDCFMFFDEEMLLDVRLNVLNKYVDKFIITESTYMHSGKPKKLIFDINKYNKFKDKIVYNVVDQLPLDLMTVNDNDDEQTKAIKSINNSSKIEHFQRESINKYLHKIDPEDLIIINDIDEIPNLKDVNLKNLDKKLIFFKQKVFFYKFNLQHEKISWFGSKACKKKYFLSPQWLRDVKDKKYPIWRLDLAFSKKKYNNIHFVLDGGWHFTNIKSPENIEKKLSNFLHYREFQESGLKLKDIKEMIQNKKIIYDYAVDQRSYKWSGKEYLKKVNLSEMPDYLIKNSNKFIQWLDV